MYPSDIKVKASEQVRTDALAYACRQITLALEDRKAMETRWEKWIKQYEEVLPEKKTFPWPNCSNVSIPLTPTTVETIHAREVNTLFTIRPYIQIKPKKSKVSRDDCAKLERFLDQIFQHVVDLYKTGSSWLLEKNKMGLGFLKVYWNYDEKKIREGTGFKRRVIDECKVDVVSIKDIILPSNATNEQTATWFDHRFRVDGNTLLRRKAQKIWDSDAVDKVLGLMRQTTVDTDTGTDIEGTEDRIQKIEKTAMSELKEYELHEIELDWDVDGDGYAEQTVMTLHLDSQTILRWIYHPYDHGKRPFVKNTYMDRVNRFYPLGICEMSEHMADAINLVFNQTVDNATIANVKCFKGRKSARKEMGQIYPGKVFWLDDPTDLMEFSLGEVHQSNFVIHNLLKEYHERRTKVNDYTAGRESSVLRSRATATGTMALLQESGRHFDLIINNSRQALVELAYQIIELYIQYRPDKVFEVEGEGGSMDIIRLPESLRGQNLRELYDFYCSATSMSVNKEIEKQANLVMLQQLGTIFDKMLQLLMLTNNPQMQLPDDIKKFVFSVIKTYYTMAEDLIRSFEKIDVNQYLPELPDIVKQAYGQDGGPQAMLQKFLQMMGGQGGQEGGNPGMAGLTPLLGMANAGGGFAGQAGGLPQQNVAGGEGGQGY